MSSTNPPVPSGPQPGAGPNWPADVKYGDAPDDSGGGGGVNPEAIRAGHEPDAFTVKPILSIPIAVVATFVIAFTVAAGAFVYFNPTPEKDPFAHPEAVARSEKGTNDRLDRTERAGLRLNPARDVDQPRLEPLKRLEKDGMFMARPPLPTGNSPEIQPEEIRPDRVPALHTAGYADHDKKFARIPIDEAMRIAAGDKTMFPVQKGGSKPSSSADKPSSSSGGAGEQPAGPKADAPVKK